MGIGKFEPNKQTGGNFSQALPWTQVSLNSNPISFSRAGVNQNTGNPKSKLKQSRRFKEPTIVKKIWINGLSWANKIKTRIGEKNGPTGWNFETHHQHITARTIPIKVTKMQSGLEKILIANQNKKLVRSSLVLDPLNWADYQFLT